MARAACLMMQKDESLLLKAWLVYHGYLFGFENLYVYDNGSTRQDVIDLLRAFEAVGVHIDRSHNLPIDFDRKGHIFGDRIREMEANADYDIVFPLDCDEFVAIADADGRDCQDGFSCSRAKIHRHLEGMVGERRMIRLRHCLDVRPGHLDLFRVVDFTKCVVPLGNFRSIDHGFHDARARGIDEVGTTDIMYVHMHSKPFADLMRHARQKLSAFVDVDDAAALRAFTGVGKHLVRYFAMTPEIYAADLGTYRYPLVRFGGFIRLLGALMSTDELRAAWCVGAAALGERQVIEIDGTFDARLYELANPDVRRSSMNAAVHYCLFGYSEGRRLRPTHDAAMPIGEPRPTSRIAMLVDLAR